ncbi:MAG: hypothetical protein ACU841_10005 [Gammaproteobacteria bacterium]
MCFSPGKLGCSRAIGLEDLLADPRVVVIADGRVFIIHDVALTVNGWSLVSPHRGAACMGERMKPAVKAV